MSGDHCGHVWFQEQNAVVYQSTVRNIYCSPYNREGTTSRLFENSGCPFVGSHHIRCRYREQISPGYQSEAFGEKSGIPVGDGQYHLR